MAKKILVLRFSSLGDVVLSTCLLSNLKSKWPDAIVYFLTKKPYVSVFHENPSVDHIWVYDSSQETFGQLVKRVRSERFDTVIDLQGNLKSFWLRLFAGPAFSVVVQKLSWARWLMVLFKWKSSTLDTSVRERILQTLPILEVPINKSETELFPSHVPVVLGKFHLPEKAQLMGLAPGSRHATKRWGEDRFIESANRLGKMENSFIVLLGDKHDEELCERISQQISVPHLNLAGQTSLSELIAVTSKLSFLLTNDSGLMHVAEAFQIPLVALFGPTVRAFGFAPYRKTSRVVEVNLTCRPCTLHGDEVCPLKHHNCMNDIDVSAVMFAVSSLLDMGATEMLGGCGQSCP